MKIAFVSYEYPPDTADGGIGTYTEQAVRMMRARGHRVEVFAGSREREGVSVQDGVPVYRVQPPTRPDFAATVAPVFALRHASQRFDLIEGPDFNADARFASALAPDAALVVRLHTPRYLTAALNALKQDAADTRPLPGYDYQADYEYRHAVEADLLTAPSEAMRDLICRDWRIDAAEIAVIPNPYDPSDALRTVPLDTETGIITFIGRLEQRKGVLSLAEAIPDVLRCRPDARFRFVGRPLPSPEPGVDMRVYLEGRLASMMGSVEFTGPVPLAWIPEVLRATDICVFPSLWENFPCVCLEAMAAGRGIVGSRRGGMAEMLQGGTGVLVDPVRPGEIGGAIVQLLNDREARLRSGGRARERVLSTYGGAVLAPQQEALYGRALERRRLAHKNSRNLTIT